MKNPVLGFNRRDFLFVFILISVYISDKIKDTLRALHITPTCT